MDWLLQLWGGAFYFSNKVFFSLAESKAEAVKRRFQIIAWSSYLIGVPAWLVLLIGKHNWIAASIEAGGIPAMLLGLYRSVYQRSAPMWAETTVKYLTYGAIILGVALSVHHFGGLTSLSQWLEVGVTIGFLLGSYLMTQNNPNAYLFFMLMNISMSFLMLIQEKNILMVQQLMSLTFVIYGYYVARSKSRASHKLC